MGHKSSALEHRSSAFRIKMSASRIKMTASLQWTANLQGLHLLNVLLPTLALPLAIAILGLLLVVIILQIPVKNIFGLNAVFGNAKSVNMAIAYAFTLLHVFNYVK